MDVGEYEIEDKFKYLEVGEDYFRMNDKQKAAVKKNFFNCSLSDENLVIVDEEPTAANKVSLSVHIDFCQMKTVTFLVLITKPLSGLTRSDVITSLWLPGNNVSWVWSANTKSGDTYTSTRWYSPCIVIVTKMQRDYIVGGEKRQGKPSLFPYKHKLHQIKMCWLFPVASLCDNTRTKPTYAYSQAALTGNEMKWKENINKNLACF